MKNSYSPRLQEVLLDAAIFDMDGTLCDSEPVHWQAYRTWLAARGVDFTELEYRQFLGATDLTLCLSLIERYGLKVAPEQMRAGKEVIYEELVRERAALRPGVRRMLDALAAMGVKMAVASSATLGAIDLMLTSMKVKHYFQVIASGEEVQNSKPAPDVFLLAAGRLMVARKRCMVVEDSINGIRAAKAAGMHCLAIPCDWTLYQDQSEADIRLTGFEDLGFTEDAMIAGNRLLRFRRADS